MAIPLHNGTMMPQSKATGHGLTDRVKVACSSSSADFLSFFELVFTLSDFGVCLFVCLLLYDKWRVHATPRLQSRQTSFVSYRRGIHEQAKNPRSGTKLLGLSDFTENSYFAAASRSGLEVKALGAYPLGPGSSSCGILFICLCVSLHEIDHQ